MTSPAAQAVLTSTLLAILAIAGFLAYAVWRYAPIIERIFEGKLMFLPLRSARVEGGEDVRFPTRDGMELVGTYFRTTQPRRLGVVVFCHEYLGDRWSALPYAGHLLEQGFDLFGFDFRNHGESQVDPAYSPLQWVTDRELTDLAAALDYVRSRHDADPAGAALFGVSKGGGAALCVAGRDPRVWGVVTDGAFPTRGTMLPYILRWAELHVGNRYLWKGVPTAVFDFLARAALHRSENRLGCRYASVERGVTRLAPRPWLAIHGAKDSYIGVGIAQGLFARAGRPKELWVVEGAKHNRCREKEPVEYAGRIADFLLRYAPRARREARDEARTSVPAPASALHEWPVAPEFGAAVTS